MKNAKDWKPLSEVLKTIKFDDLVIKLKNGTLKARGDFETDQMYQDKEDGLIECDEDGNFPKNIQEIPANCWERYEYNEKNNTIGKITSTKRGTVGWSNYSDIEIIYKRQSLEEEDDKLDTRISEIHWEIGETYNLLAKNHPDKKISASMVWNYLKKGMSENSCIIRFFRKEENNKEIIEWQSSTEKIYYLERSTFNNIVSFYKTGKKTIEL